MANRAVNPGLVVRFIFVGAILSCCIYGGDCLISSLHAGDLAPYASQAGGNWKDTGPLTTGRTAHTATLMLNGEVLAVGGINDGGVLTSSEIYDPAAGTWTGANAITTARGFHTATLLLSGRVLSVGGWNVSGYLAGAAAYDPVEGTWTIAGALTTGRANHTATLLT